MRRRFRRAYAERTGFWRKHHSKDASVLNFFTGKSLKRTFATLIDLPPALHLEKELGNLHGSGLNRPPGGLFCSAFVETSRSAIGISKLFQVPYPSKSSGMAPAPCGYSFSTLNYAISDCLGGN